MINTKSVTITRDQALAIKALREGTADSNQQTVALDWIIYQAAGLAVSQFVEGSDDGRRATDFMTGRAFTGQQILGVAMSPMDALFKPGNEKADK